ncbi:MAG: UTP--glucose-1-phosphate uridylyltransferase [Cyanobacteria bacterium NC_groundwater_1444_Ag_S-0.65um_54_12]|nr:UTP--glucose-1-phosphate uridylyltransferase [Cyanobacteria bacterium NC_groundwater_1444_Ag_S-0.65um_54_12]
MEQIFEQLVARFRAGSWTVADNILTGQVEAPVTEDLVALPPRDSAEYCKLAEIGRQALLRGELGLVILAGGMATRFGWGKPKGIFPVYQDMSFLGWKIRWAQLLCGPGLPIFIMTSFHTDAAIRAHLAEHGYFDHVPERIHIFQQYGFRRLLPDGSFFSSSSGAEDHATPGHGDFPLAMRDSGLLERFLRDGGTTLLFSNVDNLGATPELAVVGFHRQSGMAMTAEVAAKDPGDKGGAPARVNGRRQLVEGFAFPVGFDQESIPVFNTATYCFCASALNSQFDLPWYIVEKTVEGTAIIQFEHLAGDLSVNLSCAFLTVDRNDRFIPVKSQADLAVAQVCIAKKHEWLQNSCQQQAGE